MQRGRDINLYKQRKRKTMSQNVFPTFPNRKWIWPERDIDFLSGVGTGSADVDLICTSARRAPGPTRSDQIWGIGEFATQSNARDRCILAPLRLALRLVGVTTFKLDSSLNQAPAVMQLCETCI